MNKTQSTIEKVNENVFDGCSSVTMPLGVWKQIVKENQDLLKMINVTESTKEEKDDFKVFTLKEWKERKNVRK